MSEDLSVHVITPAGGPAVFAVDGYDGPLWRCLNAAWGCNWMLAADAGDVWCRSCRLTRGRPDESRQDAVEAWVQGEAAKRRLVHQLDTLSLPIEPRSATSPDGLAFDLVHLPGEGSVTGHLDGLVTLDLEETDDVHRDRLRRELGEPFRTVIGHLRHELGHHYWNRLVGQSDHLAQFRRLFGDERADYQQAIATHYSPQRAAWDPTRHVTAYAAAHPLEDWAETFAHYLHIIDVTSTAAAHHLVAHEHAGAIAASDLVALDFDEVLAIWRPVITAVNEIAASLGAPTVYPLQPAGLVIDKLTFVHRRVVAHSTRDRFYADA